MSREWNEWDDQPRDAENGVPPAAGKRRLDTLAAEYAAQRERVEAMKAALAPEQERLDRATDELFDAMEALGLRNFRHETLGLFGLSDLADAKVLDPATFVEWAKVQMPEILHPNYQRLSKLVRDSLKGEHPFGENLTLPPGVDFATRRGITWRRKVGRTIQ